MSADVRVIAFYLPQFHPIPENDRWWGPGFTEWTNVRRGRPMYAGHKQPRQPGELGYYDLRQPGVRGRQVELARQYGVYGFCYYYYWFSGQRLLEQPLDLMLADRDGDFPFCICWANENWSRRWDGSEQDILIAQKHLPDDPPRFIRDLAPVLRDSRYIRVGGAPLLLVYRPQIIPDLTRVVNEWRKAAEDLGIGPLHLCAVQSFGDATGLEHGFDAMVEFPAHLSGVGDVTNALPDVVPEFTGKIFSYPDLVKHCLGSGSPPRLPVYRGLIAGWDNTARRGYASQILHEGTPEHYEMWLRRLVADTRRRHRGDRRLVFVNAWNEWGEGAYLEPDQHFGDGFLEATSRALGADQGGDIRHIEEGPIEGVARFVLLEGSGGALPTNIVPDSVGFLDVLNSPNHAGPVTLDKAYDVLVAGWVACSRIEVSPSSSILFQLSSRERGVRYIAFVSSRTRRDDVVAHLRAVDAFRDVSESCLLYSGYRAYLDVSHVEPGTYQLDVIVPGADSQDGTTMRLHSSIAVP